MTRRVEVRTGQFFSFFLLQNKTKEPDMRGNFKFTLTEISQTSKKTQLKYADIIDQSVPNAINSFLTLHPGAFKKYFENCWGEEAFIFIEVSPFIPACV
jgi:hypothetical protein